MRTFFSQQQQCRGGKRAEERVVLIGEACAMVVALSRACVFASLQLETSNVSWPFDQKWQLAKSLQHYYSYDYDVVTEGWSDLILMKFPIRVVK